MTNEFEFLEKREKLIFSALFACFLAFSILYLIYGRMTLEEGAYVYAGKLVYSGTLLYRDFQYSQTPVMPYVYGIFLKIFGTSLIMGRVISLLFSILAVVFAYFTARRLSGKTAALLTLTILAFSQVMMLYFTKPLTYSLTSFFIVLTIYFLTSESDKVQLFSLISIVLAMGTRLTMVVGVFPIITYLLYKNLNHKKNLLYGFLIFTGTLAVVFLPFLILAKKNFLYWTITGQLTRGNVIIYYKNIPNLVVQYRRLEYIFNSINSYKPVFFIAFTVIFYGIFNFLKSENKREWISRNSLNVTILAIIIGNIFITSLAFPAYIHYNSLVIPIAAIFASMGLLKILKNFTRTEAYLLFSLVIILIAVGGVPFKGGLSAVNPVKSIWQVNDIVQKYSKKGDEILTFSVVAAIENDREIPHGLERGIYTYHPMDPLTWAREHNLFATKDLLSYIASRKSKVVILTDRYFYGYFLEPVPKIREQILKEINKNYTKKTTITNYSDFGNAYLYVLKDEK